MSGMVSASALVLLRKAGSTTLSGFGKGIRIEGETAFDFYTNEEIGVVAYLLEQKKKGRIRHLGFSAHGRPETIEKFLLWSESHFPDGCFEIAQIQLNYLDWTLQNAKKVKFSDGDHEGLKILNR